MSGWIAIARGLALLVGVASDRKNIRSAWRAPARWLSLQPREYLRSREPSQPLNLVLGVVLGTAALIYGIVAVVN